MRTIRGMTYLLAAAVFPALATAQTLESTGASQSGGRDLRWDISTNAGGTWSSAFVIPTVPFQWTNGAPGGTWIGATATGSGGGTSFRVRSLFTLALGDAFSFQFRCAADDGPVTFFINGTSQAGNPCSRIWTWGSVIGVGSTNFQSGQNSIEFAWNGNNTTDGMAIQIVSQTLIPDPSVVPEPASVALFASGLAGLALVARRRRRI